MEILENLPVPVILISKNCRIHYLNAEGKVLLKKETLEGTYFYSHLVEDSAQIFTEFLNSLLLGTTAHKSEIEFIVSESQTIRLEIKGRPSIDQEMIHLTAKEVTESNGSRFSYKTKYEEIKTVANIGHWELDLQKNEWQYCSKIFEFYEIDPAQTEITPELFYHLIHPEDRDKVTNAFEKSLQEKKIYEVDHRILLNQGKIKWIRETCHWIFDAEENPIGAIGTSQEITKQVELEEKIRNDETNYYNMVENTSSLIWSCDKDGRFTYINPAWERVLGYKKEEMIHRYYFEF
jgi:hypothetical protein